MSSNIPVKQVDPSSEPSNNKKSAETVELYASRKKIYVREVKGFFQRIRNVSLTLLMGMYFLFVWITVDGQPLIHFDLPAREFHLYGATFYPRDFILLSGMLIMSAFGLFFITTLFGRVWCGYTCPQTVWTFIFMWVEERIEGSRNKRMKLDKAPTSKEKILKKSAKHTVWLLIALATGLTFVGYFYPIRELLADLFTLNANGWAYFWVAFFTVATYLNAGWMREQVCLYMCPYARFQSVMFDPNTRVVSYDPNRGEPRGSRKKGVAPSELGLGDCIDCGQCVQVCPTGIDIRDGLQYQCIGCAHCIDACNQVMDKMGYEPGLIRYTTETELAGGRTHWLRFRSVGYAIALLVMMTAFTYAVLTRNALEVDVLRERGELYQLVDGRVVNQYRLRLLNKTQQPATVAVSVESALPMTIEPTEPVVLAPNELLDLSLILSAPASAVTAPNSEVTIRLCDTDTGRCDTEATRFLGPTP